MPKMLRAPELVASDARARLLLLLLLLLGNDGGGETVDDVC